MNAFRTSIALALLSALSCNERPARYADRPPVTEIVDRQPVPLPGRTPLIEAVYLSETYLRRPLVGVLDAERVPRAGDVNSLDEVPPSSWWDPRPEDTGAIRVRLHHDPKGYPNTETAALVIASRLVRKVGYRTPEARRVSKTTAEVRWPIGFDLGPTPMSGVRPDDPNDRIPHRDRRTLRALSVLAAWLEIRDLGPERLIDVYMGLPGEGHVQHLVVGLHSALGAAELGPASARRTAAGIVRGSALDNLITLGLARPPTGSTARSLSVLSRTVDPERSLDRPWEPADRMGPDDGYWIAKRIAAISPEEIAVAVGSAALDPHTHAHVVGALESRRRILIAYWLAQVTPLELASLEGDLLVLSDRAIELGYATDGATRYAVRFLNENGEAIRADTMSRADGGELELRLPREALDLPYFLLRVTGFRDGKELPRPFEAHVSTRGEPHVVGIRH